MDNDDFEKRYAEYLTKNKGRISYKLWEERNDFEFNFGNFVSKYNFGVKVLLPIFIIGGLACSIIDAEKYLFLKILSFALWIGYMLWLWIFEGIAKKDISDYFFNKYKRNQIIEELVRRDEKQEIEEWQSECFEKFFFCGDKEVFAEIYKSKYYDIKMFYDQCLEKLKYENLEQRS